MRSEIIKLHQRLRATMIYVTHDQVEAMTMGDRIVVMQDGVIQQIDTPLNLYRRPANLFVAGFLGTPAMNFIAGQVESSTEDGVVFRARGGERRCFEFSRNAATELPAGRDVVLGIRPEDVKLSFEIDEKSATGVRAVVELVEPMGAETIVHLRFDTHLLMCRLERQVEHDMMEQQVWLQIDAGKVHLFDPETMLRLS